MPEESAIVESDVLWLMQTKLIALGVRVKEHRNNILLSAPKRPKFLEPNELPSAARLGVCLTFKLYDGLSSEDYMHKVRFVKELDDFTGFERLCIMEALILKYPTFSFDVVGEIVNRIQRTFPLDTADTSKFTCYVAYRVTIHYFGHGPAHALENS